VHRGFGILAGAILLCSLGACGGEAPAPRPRNVLLITLDTTRADHLGAYGSSVTSTPRLDELARRGTRFDLALATASVTPVSHASILTGLWNDEHRLRVLSGSGGYRLPDDVPTLATLLADGGWHTAAVHSAFPVSSYFGLERGFAAFDDVDATLEPDEAAAGETSWDLERYQRRSDETSSRALAVLAELERPFLLWVHYWDPHDGKRRPPDWQPPAERDATFQVALYRDEVSYLDGEIGRLLDGLAAAGLAEETVIVVVADHGQGLGDHGWEGHRLLYQEQIRVPLVVVAPGLVQAGAVGDLVSTVDVLPTVLDLVGIEPPPGLAGRSLRPLLEGEALPARPVFADQINLFDSNAHMLGERPKDDLLHCVVDGRWKLVYRPTRPDESELFDLETDPCESHDLFDERRDEATRLLKELARRAPWVTAPPASLEEDPATRAAAGTALSALGYAASEALGTSELVWRWVCPDPAHAGDVGEHGACRECGSSPVPELVR
jgi:arylsulfatase A-like enzyme